MKKKDTMKDELRDLMDGVLKLGLIKPKEEQVSILL